MSHVYRYDRRLAHSHPLFRTRNVIIILPLFMAIITGSFYSFLLAQQAHTRDGAISNAAAGHKATAQQSALTADPPATKTPLQPLPGTASSPPSNQFIRSSNSVRSSSPQNCYSKDNLKHTISQQSRIIKLPGTGFCEIDN